MTDASLVLLVSIGGLSGIALMVWLYRRLSRRFYEKGWTDGWRAGKKEALVEVLEKARTPRGSPKHRRP